MGGGHGSQFPQQQLHWQLPNLNSSNSPMHPGQCNFIPPIMTPGTLNAFLKERLPASPYENFRERIGPKTSSGCGAQKKFLVFDQSADQTTLIFSSGIENPVKHLTSWSLKPPGSYEGDGNLFSAPNSFDEINGTDLQSEMHEDTEELNALLYSDDDSGYTDDDDEVTSTGHSPSTLTANEKLDWFEGNEEVASSAGPTKKRKLFDRDHMKFNSEDDAESSCSNSLNPRSGETGGSISRNKRTRNQKIRETVSVLRSIIPGGKGKGKDAMVVIDKAIDYLKFLKLKAETFGLDSL